VSSPLFFFSSRFYGIQSADGKKNIQTKQESDQRNVAATDQLLQPMSGS
jgi:hypothetical protein